MALKFIYSMTSGIVVPEAYAHITQFSGVKDTVNVRISIYKDKAAREANKVPVDKLEANLKLSNGASYTQIYAELKTKPLFLNSTDI